MRTIARPYLTGRRTYDGQWVACDEPATIERLVITGEVVDLAQPGRPSRPVRIVRAGRPFTDRFGESCCYGYWTPADETPEDHQ